MNIVFQKIVSTPDGVGATEGRYMEKYFNDNFDDVASYLQNLFSIVSVQVSSNDVTQLKVDTSTTPYSIYYSLDPIDTESPTWHLLTTTFANISGDPMANIALKGLLDAKANVSTVNTLQSQVNSNTTNISELTTNVSELSTNVGTLSSQVETLSEDVTGAIKTDDGSTMYIRYNALTNSVEYSLDLNSWHSIIASNINFVDISGLPEDNANLVQYITNQITSAVAGFVTTQTLSQHTTNYNNPHQVTPDQIGLGTVLQDIETLKSLNGSGSAMTLDAYLDAQSDEGELTFISSHYVDPDTYGTWTQVATVTEEAPYNTVDGEQITINTPPSDLEPWYRMEPTEAGLIIKYNEQLRTYEKGGDV